MSIVKKISYLLESKDKMKVLILLAMTIVGSAMELLGVTIVIPVINLAMVDIDINENKYASIVMNLTGATTKEAVLLWIILAVIVIYTLKNCYLVIMNSTIYRFAGNTKKKFATRLMKAYLKQPYSFFLQTNTSVLIRAVNSDTAELYETITNCLFIVSNTLTATCIIVFLAISDWLMTLVVTLMMGGCVLLIVGVLQKKYRRFGRENQKYNGFLIRHLQQAFEGIKEIKILNNEDYFVKSYGETYTKQTQVTVKSSLYNLIPKYIIEVVSIAAILGYLAFRIAFTSNYVEVIPQLAVFCYAAYKLLPSVNAIYTYFNTIVGHKAAVDLVYHDIVEAEQLEANFEKNPEEENEVTFIEKIALENVSFRYEGTERWILQSADLAIRKGTSVAFVGASGGGKTTTADIILSLLSPIEGKVTVDGANIRDNLSGWRRKVGYIPQFIYLTDESIRNNIAFGIKSDEIDEKRIWKALEEAQLVDFVKSLPEGLDTLIGERGARISGGQRQRIGIARALYRNPEVLVFDEATSALDNDTEKEVMRAVDGLQGTKTIIIIAHRLSTIENCDAVYRIENGQIKES